MNASLHAWWNFGYAGIFGCVFLEQIGVPIPAFPALIGAGALVAVGELNLALCLVVAVASALLADLIWYSIGWARGGKVLNLMCKLSWRPDTCVSKTKNAFSDYGAKTLVIAKFVPGLSTLAPPLAGITQVPLTRFVLYDGVGTVLWAVVPLLAGAYLQQSMATLQARAYAMVPYLPWICGTLILAVLAWRYFNRNRYMKAVEKDLKKGIIPDELKSLLDQGSDLALIDVRDEISLKETPLTLPKARWIPYGQIIPKLSELCLSKPIVVYCDCPRDQASVAVVDTLRKHGATQARPLLGGLEAWRAKGFETAKFDFPA